MQKQLWEICMGCKNKSRRIVTTSFFITKVRIIPYPLCKKCYEEMEKGEKQEKEMLILIEKNLEEIFSGNLN